MRWGSALSDQKTSVLFQQEEIVLSHHNLYWQGPDSSLTFASELFNTRWHEERSCFLEALCCILLMTPRDIDRVAPIHYTLVMCKGVLFCYLWNPDLGWLSKPICPIWAHLWGTFWRLCWSSFVVHHVPFCIDV